MKQIIAPSALPNKRQENFLTNVSRIVFSRVISNCELSKLVSYDVCMCSYPQDGYGKGNHAEHTVPCSGRVSRDRIISNQISLTKLL